MTEARVKAVGGGITAPQGFRSAGVASGIKAQGLDLALIVSDAPATAAGVFTTNRAQAAPILVSREQLDRSGGRAVAIVVNSGCANACTGADGLSDAWDMVQRTSDALRCEPSQVLVASTGVIGVKLDMAKVDAGIASAAGQLSRAGGPLTARAIMTTDPFPKEASIEVSAPQGAFRVGGIAKGSGMIEPMMATMLAFVTMDA
ncbi:MAG: bifunctional ornithine acetyltransferase/N-acetylglutamate synthase, partial [Gemmatirosa sp.]